MNEVSNYVHHVQDIAVALKSFLQQLKPDKLAVLVDENTRKHCLIHLRLTSETTVIEIKSGEEFKNLESCSKIWELLTQAGFTRSSLLINLGGGVIGDMGGFVAATFKRGIRFITIPTTLLSQVDASVGGKLGIDFLGLKNHIGVFQLPAAVLICDQFLKTLPLEELRSGYAEVIKHALIRDAAYWNFLQNQNFPNLNWNEIVQHSTMLKQEVTEADPMEKGLRKILNFGHTVGHAIETWSLNSGHKILHGEAIAAGMLIENIIAVNLGKLSQHESDGISRFLLNVFGKLQCIPQYHQIDELLSQDKKNEGSEIRMSLVTNLGSCTYDVLVTKSEIQSALEIYRNII
jgi:3-dehydroquinate synthase